MVRVQKGFTIVEIVVIIAVIAILAGITVVAFGDWRDRAARSEVKHDLSNASSALQNHINFANSYPANATEFSKIYDSTDTVNLTYTLRPDNSYCVQAASIAKPGVVYNIDSRVSGTEPAEGGC